MLFDLPVIEENTLTNSLEQHKTDLLNEIKSLISEINNDEIFTREKVLEILDCSKTWLSQMTTNGTIPYGRIGNRVYYTKQNLLNLVNGKKKKNKSS